MEDSTMARQWTPLNGNGQQVTLRLVSSKPNSAGKRVIASVEGPTKSLAEELLLLTPQKRRKTSSKQPSTSPACHTMVTRGKSRDAACRAVFNTHELTLMILNELPMQQLLQVRRVCRAWHAIIMHDRHLLTQLFLLPEPRAEVWAYDTRLITVKAYNPSTTDNLDQEWLARQRKTTPGKLNPILFAKDFKHEHYPGIKNNVLTMMKWCDTARFLRRPALGAAKTGTSLVHSMYVCQPPCTEVEFKWFVYAGKPTITPGVGFPEWKFLRIRVWNDKGVKFGDLVQGFVSEARKSKVFDDVDPEEFFLKRAPSVIWMKGVCFPTEGEREEVACGMWDMH